MAYDESEDPEDLLKFYNFGSMSEQDFEAAIVDTETTPDDEIRLESGERLGHRRFMRYYKQKLRKPSHEEQDEGRYNPLSLTNGEGSANQDVTFEPRNRKERRSKLAITDGSANHTQADMLSRLPQSVQKDYQQRQASSKRSNRVATKHLRIQNPV